MGYGEGQDQCQGGGVWVMVRGRMSVRVVVSGRTTVGARVRVGVRFRVMGR